MSITVRYFLVMFTIIFPLLIVLGGWVIVHFLHRPKCQHEWVAALHDYYPFIGEVTLIICRKCEKKRTMKTHYWEALNDVEEKNKLRTGSHY